MTRGQLWTQSSTVILLMCLSCQRNQAKNKYCAIKIFAFILLASEKEGGLFVFKVKTLIGETEQYFRRNLLLAIKMEYFTKSRTLYSPPAKVASEGFQGLLRKVGQSTHETQRDRVCELMEETEIGGGVAVAFSLLQTKTTFLLTSHAPMSFFHWWWRERLYFEAAAWCRVVEVLWSVIVHNPSLGSGLLGPCGQRLGLLYAWLS